jgi:hypothetical protein
MSNRKGRGRLTAEIVRSIRSMEWCRKRLLTRPDDVVCGSMEHYQRGKIAAIAQGRNHG